MEMQADAQKFQADSQLKLQLKQMELESEREIARLKIESQERIALHSAQMGRYVQNQTSQYGQPSI